MKTEQYVRKPFEVEAVQVTQENMGEVAKWCMGDVRYKAGPERNITRYVKVRVHRPLNARQTEAFVGDWVLYAHRGYKVYTEKAFEDNFVKSNAEWPHKAVAETEGVV